MTTWRSVKLSFKNIMKEIDSPNIIMLHIDDWSKIFYELKSNELGHCKLSLRTFTLRYKNYDKSDIEDTIWHEILHILYPYAPHWQVECCAQRLSGSKRSGYYTKIYGHDVNDVPYRRFIIYHIKNNKHLHKKMHPYMKRKLKKLVKLK